MKRLLLIFVVLNLIVVPLTINAQSNNFEVKVENGATATPITNGYYIDGVDNSGESAGVVYTKAPYKTYIFETKIKPIKCWGEITISQCSVIEDNGMSVDTPTQESWGLKDSKGKILRYEYTREYPHHGFGQWVAF